ncbi:Glyoxylase I 4-like protein [Drosera capensis]
MASLLAPPLAFHPHNNNKSAHSICQGSISSCQHYGVVGMHHVGILCENLERSLNFYQDVLGLEINEARPADKLPYRGAWLWVGSEMIHLMELPNPDLLTGRPAHGGRDRHACILI